MDRVSSALDLARCIVMLLDSPFYVEAPGVRFCALGMGTRMRF